MKKNSAKIHRISDEDILFGKKNQDSSSVYKMRNDGCLEFSHISDNTIGAFLTLHVDSMFINIMQSCLLWISKRGAVQMSEVAVYLSKQNPLEIDEQFIQNYYNNIIAKFISQIASCSEKDYNTPEDCCQPVEIQHGKSYVRHYPIQLGLPYVLIPYCTLSARKQEEYIDAEGQKFVKIKLIVQYRDKTAPTKLGKELSEVLALLPTDAVSVYEKISQMSIHVYDKYKEQSSFFGKEMIEMVNGQVY